MLFWLQVNLFMRIWVDPFGLLRPTANKKKARDQ